MHFVPRVALLALMLSCLATPSRAAWPRDASIPRRVFDAAAVQVAARFASGAASDGGILVVSLDSLVTGSVIRAQRIDSLGMCRWGADGVTVATLGDLAISQAENPAIARDGGSGAFVAYSRVDIPSGAMRTYVKRLRADGSSAWSLPTAVSTATGEQGVRWLQALEDGSVIVVWADRRSGDLDLYVQRIDSTGVRLFPDTGLLVAGGTGHQDTEMGACARGAVGRTAIGFIDTNSGLIAVQQFDDAGNLLWGAGGARVSPGLSPQASLQNSPRLCMDGAGNVWVTWVDRRNGPGRSRFFAQTIAANGVAAWGNGVQLTNQRSIIPIPSTSLASRILGVPMIGLSGSAWFTWCEQDTITNALDARAARLGASGTALTPAGGANVSTALGATQAIVAVPDGGQGWTAALYEQDASPELRGLHVSASGIMSAHAPVVSADYMNDGFFVSAVPDGAGGLLGVWRDAAGVRLLAARVTRDACLGGDTPVLESVTDTPLDDGGSVNLCWQRACHDTTFTTLYRVLRRPAGSGEAWTDVAQYDAIGLAMNCYAAPTAADSGVSGAAEYEWRIVWEGQASGSDSSNIVIAHSADNLPPAPVGNVVVEFHPGSAAQPISTTAGSYNAVRWTASPSADVTALRVYRDAWPAFTPSPATLVGELAANALSLTDPSDHPAYYKIVPIDHAGNAGPAAGAPPMAPTAQSLVFSADFDTALPPEITAPGCNRDLVQGWAGLGTAGNTFGGRFLRYSAVPLSDTRMVLRGLPAHTHVSLAFLLAIIDSWDGVELLRVSIDGVLRFENWFQLATGDASSYAAPPGGLLHSGTDLGYSGGGFYFHDRAYDMSVEPAFRDIPHTADSLVVVWNLGAVSGPAATQWQGGSDESWAIDNVRVTLTRAGVEVPPALVPMRLALSGSRPNPSLDGRLHVWLTLPSSEPARLEVFDVAGRRVAARDVGRFGTGTHRVDLGDQVRLAPGLYLLRLSQGQNSCSARAIVTD